jgi:prevent-host-death family protein
MWQVQEAKAKFSELLDKTLSEGPQVVSRRGVAAAVLVPIEEWERLKQRARPSLKDLLLSDENRFEIDLPPRGKWKSRPVIRFEDE